MAALAPFAGVDGGAGRAGSRVPGREKLHEVRCASVLSA